jgi:hypothetical protein
VGKANDKVYVISGPIFSRTVQKLNDRVAIPTAFFKIVLRQVDGTLQAQTFRLFNDEHLPIPPGGHLHPTLTKHEADLYLLAHAESMKKEQNASTALWPVD